jgi:hypothetical protein
MSEPISNLDPFKPGDILTAARLNEIIATCNSVLSEVRALNPANGNRRMSFWARLGAATAGLYPFAEQKQIAASTEAADGLAASPDGIAGSARLANSDLVQVHARMLPDGRSKEYWFESGDGIALLWGKAVGAWTTGNSVELNPCSSAGVDNGLANVKVHIDLPFGVSPASVVIASGDLLAYIPYGATLDTDKVGVLAPVKQGAGTTGVSTSLAVVVSVGHTSTSLWYKTKTLTIVDGLITAIGDLSSANEIDPGETCD